MFKADVTLARKPAHVSDVSNNTVVLFVCFFMFLDVFRFTIVSYHCSYDDVFIAVSHCAM